VYSYFVHEEDFADSFSDHRFIFPINLMVCRSMCVHKNICVLLCNYIGNAIEISRHPQKNLLSVHNKCW
jgi:hypothetical protein